ncbi:MAG: hypothetical protein A2V70_16260 [Planctomycetes bacterium RBG_13_63_9]|nr:MAG: hypothetical protein A2V70_16260 [Planctomycetes bacterium RBG_13_63_9]
MGSSPQTLTIALLAAGLVFASGCTSSPWSATRLADPPTEARPAQPPPPRSSAAMPDATDSPGKPPAQALQEVMAELQQLHALDPAAQETLMADLKQTDPALWPLVLHQFRAATAYRRRAQQQEMAAADPNRSAQFGPLASHTDQPPAAGPIAQRQQLSQANGPATEGPDRLPAADNAALPPNRPPPDYYPTTAYPPIGQLAAHGPPEDPQTVQQTVQQTGPVINASYDPAAPGDWRAHLDSAIAALESGTANTPKTQDEIAQHAQLRMLRLLAGRRDRALEPIPNVAPATEEFWSKELYGLDAWLDTKRTPDAMRRSAEAKRILGEALARLGETAPLEVRNLAFCSEIQSYGCIKEFEEYDFTPGQEVLLYAEIENFASESTAKGAHTSLRSSYQIYDSRGQRAADHDFSHTEEYCQTARRDFFIGYHLRLPSRIYPGKYTLQLTVEDLKSHKVGQSSIDLTISSSEARESTR